MLEVSCRHRKAIGAMVTKSRILKVELEQYDLKWQQLKHDLSSKDKLKKMNKNLFKIINAVKGDQIDEKFAKAIQESGYVEITVIRTGNGAYLFGTKNITVKLVNNKLVIRVGGGYTSEKDFIE